jgi:hypothetical protein
VVPPTAAAGSGGPAAAGSGGPAAAGSGGPWGIEERAAAGELAALKALDAIDDRRRTAAQALALARGRAELARGDVGALLAAVERQPELAHDRATLARFFDLIEHEPVALDAIAAVARLPGPEGADLLQATWRRHRHTIAGLLARDLLRSEACRTRASEALLVVIELEEQIDARPPAGERAERRCRAIRGLIERAAGVGDRRASAVLTELDSRQGCGNGKEDCYPCLRDDEALAKAKEAVAGREVEAPWALRR